MRQRYTIEESNREPKVEKECFACKRRGIIIRRVNRTERGLQVTPNRTNMCTNKRCFRYTSAIPGNWIEDNEQNIEHAKRRERHQIRDRRHPRGSE